MHILKRGVFLVENSLSRHFFSFLILFSLFLISLTAWSILTSLDLHRNESLKQDYSIVTVEFDTNSIIRDKVNPTDENFVHPSKKEYEKLSKLPEVESYEINLKDVLLSANLVDISEENSSNIGLFSIKGINSNPIFDVKFNNIDITDGRTISESEINDGSNSVLLSKEIARKNKLNVGDNIVLKILNPYDISKVFEQNMKLVGIFTPSGKINSQEIKNQNLTPLLKDVLHDSHEDNEKENKDTSFKSTTKTEFDNVVTLQKMFLLDDLNTIYMSNKASEILAKNVDRAFQSNVSSIDYQASYILNSANEVNDFKLKAEKILPDYFTIYDVKDAYTSWLPYTSRNMIILEIIVILSIILALIIFTFIEIIEIFKNKTTFTKHILLGKNLTIANAAFLKKEISLLASTILASTLIAPWLSQQIIVKYLTNLKTDTSSYFNIQNFYRNLIDTTTPLTHYSTFNIYYLLAPIFIFLISLLLLSITLKFVEKRLFKGVLI